MAINLSALVENTRTISIKGAGGELSVTYDPSKLSAAYMQEITEKLEEDDPLAIADMFCHIVKDWDLVGPFLDAGHNDHVKADQKVPLEKRYVGWVPTPLLQAIIQAVGEDASPKSQEKPSRRR